MDKQSYFKQMRQQRRESILKEAKQIILKEGYDTFNMQLLARRLDISTVTLYKYFSNSDSILNAIREQILADGTTFLSQIEQTEEPLEDFLQSLRSFFSNVIKNHADMTFLFLCKIHTQNAASPQKEMSVYNDLLYAQLLNARASGSIRKELNLQEVLDMISYINTGIIHQFSMMDEKTFYEQLESVNQKVEQLLEFYRYYLQA